MEMRHVVFHKPGPAWKIGVGFREQPGVMAHVQHYAKLLAEGKLFKGGPVVDADSGGMMIATGAVSKEALDAFAAEDPAIQSGLLTYEIKRWYVAMTGEEG